MQTSIFLQDDLIAGTAAPPMFLKCDLQNFNFKDLNNKFDVILVEPPLEEYQRTMGVTNTQFWSWEKVDKYIYTPVQISIFNNSDGTY